MIDSVTLHLSPTTQVHKFEHDDFTFALIIRSAFFLQTCIQSTRTIIVSSFE